MKVRQSVREALSLLTRRDQRLLGVTVLIQMSTSFLDLIGVLLLGLVGALAVTTVQSQPAPASVTALAEALGLGSLSDQQLVMVFAGAAAFVLLVKSVVASLLTRRVFRFLANRQALVSARLAKALLSRPLTFLQERSTQETAFALIQGAGLATVQILGQLVMAITEVTLLIVLGVALLFLDPIVTLAAIAFFALVAWGLQRAMGGWASRVGGEAARADIASLNVVQEALNAYREITVANRRDLYVAHIQRLRWDAARATADSTFIQQVPKYVLEAALVLGGFALAGILFTTQDAVSAVSTLALFLAAGSRVMPSLLRLQGAALGLRGSAAGAGATFDLAKRLGNPHDDPGGIEDDQRLKEILENGHSGFTAEVRVHDVSVQYPGSAADAVQNVSLSVREGQSIALVGRSGAGKSTLADLILGVLQPTSGSVTISGVPAPDALRRWPGAIAYVPQEVVLANGNIRENVALGLPRGAVDDDRVWRALARAHLDTYLHQQREGLDTLIGEGGMRLSGGQRQRLGIARALFTEPKLLVLDEATSALDAETEIAITQTIHDLEGDVTTIVIAHRLATVRSADHVVYLEEGCILATGAFDEVRRRVPALERQASLLGL